MFRLIAVLSRTQLSFNEGDCLAAATVNAALSVERAWTKQHQFLVARKRTLRTRCPVYRGAGSKVCPLSTLHHKPALMFYARSVYWYHPWAPLVILVIENT